MSNYRIREAVVLVANGYRDVLRRMFIAERRISVFGILSFWWPCDGMWQHSEDAALADAERDAYLRQPLKAPVLLKICGEI